MDVTMKPIRVDYSCMPMHWYRHKSDSQIYRNLNYTETKQQ